jgi:endonuclease YncB( thermonuclease family)
MAGPALAAPASCVLEGGETHDVARVIDGETLALDDGREVRLIGALAPQPDASIAPDAWPPALAAKRALQALIGEQAVMLRYEGRRQDRYGRVLAQVFVASAGNAQSGADRWLQEAMVRAGQARAYALPGNGACLRDLTAAEAEARDAGRGLWARETYRVRAASDVTALLRLTGRFAVVEGRIDKVGRTAKTIYLNFSADWRHDFTASLAAAPVEREPGGISRADGLAGHRVRVRGWIERRNGPLIALGSLDEVEVLDAAGDASPPSGEARMGKTPSAQDPASPPDQIVDP